MNQTKEQLIGQGRHLIGTTVQELAVGLALYGNIPVSYLAKALVEMDQAISTFAKADPEFLAELEREMSKSIERDHALRDKRAREGKTTVGEAVTYRLVVQPYERPETPPAGQE